jgi:hypothetical protein
MPQITTVTSEALQATIRRLLPSQQGFGQDLEAQNVIVPIIDLTPTAEGSALPTDLARAIGFASSTKFSIVGTSTTIANTPGFYRVFGMSSVLGSNSVNRNATWKLENGATSNNVWQHAHRSGGVNGEVTVQQYDFTVFLDTGDAIKGTTDASCVLAGSVRQVADRYGNTVNPNGFTFE